MFRCGSPCFDLSLGSEIISQGLLQCLYSLSLSFLAGRFALSSTPAVGGLALALRVSPKLKHSRLILNSNAIQDYKLNRRSLYFLWIVRGLGWGGCLKREYKQQEKVEIQSGKKKKTQVQGCITVGLRLCSKVVMIAHLAFSHIFECFRPTFIAKL
jgi:hypothetical protein